jgi:hypothetical protein
MSRPNGPTEPDLTKPEWMSLDDACAYAGRSRTAIKDWVNKGKIGKRLVPKPGARPRVELWRQDLDRLFTGVVEVPTLAEPDQTTALVPTKPDQTASLNGLAPVLEKLAEWLKPPEIYVLERKLTWTLAEARTMTGLSRPMLRDLAESHPEIVLRRGRRMWFMAGRLREVLG